MLDIILFNKLSEVEQLDFVSAKNLQVITPNPNLSDAFRSHYQQESTDSISVDVITISKFLKDMMSIYNPELIIKRKVDLLLELSIVWRIKAPELSYEAFTKTFNTLTDLRSYTTSLDLLEEVLTELDEVEANMLKLFWLYMEQVDLIDEHGANEILAKSFLDEASEHTCKDIVFWGFSHLSGTQIDLIKNLSINHNVYIPFPRSVYNKSKSTDWVRWLGIDEQPDVMQVEDKVPVNCHFFDSNRLNTRLNELSKNSSAEYLLMEKAPTLRQVGEVPLGEVNFRVSLDLFSSIVAKLFYQVHIDFTQNEVMLDEMVEWIKKAIEVELIKPLKEKEFRYLKVLGIFLENVLQYSEKTDQKKYLDSFDIKLLHNLVEMSVPRTFASIINESNPKHKVLGLESFDALSDSGKKIICISKQYSEPGIDKFPYSETMAEVLASIAPVRSAELENNIIKFKLEQLVVNNPECLFMIEKNVLEKSIGWIRFLQNFEFNSIELANNEKDINYQDYLGSIIKHQKFIPNSWSATRLQTYLDCPRKYYFNYINKVETPRDLKFEILAMDLGILEHRIIEVYVEANNKYDEKKHYTMVNEHLGHYLKSKSKSFIRKLDLESYEYELKLYSKRAIVELLKFKEIPNVEIQFEVEDWKSSKVRGSIDCIIEFPNKNFIIIDFKRSKNAITTIDGFRNFQKIQLWFYQKYLNRDKRGELKGMGYLTLGDLTKSLFFINEDTIDVVKSTGFLEKIRFKKEIETTLYENYAQFELDLINDALNDESFKANPLNKKSCEYCSVKNLCPKGELNNGQNSQ